MLRSVLSDMRIATPAFFCFPFAWNVFFHLLTFSLYVSLGLKWVSCRQPIYGSCFYIHSASLCLLVGAFNPFTFKVFISIYVPIAISSGTPIIWMLVHLILSQRSLRYPQSFSFFLLYSPLQKLFPPFYLPAHWFILLLQIFCYWFYQDCREKYQ